MYNKLLYSQTLIFFNELIRLHRNTVDVIECFIKFALERICDVFMFCEDISPCKKEAKDVIHFILDMHMLRSESSLGYANICSKFAYCYRVSPSFNLFVYVFAEMSL